MVAGKFGACPQQMLRTASGKARGDDVQEPSTIVPVPAGGNPLHLQQRLLRSPAQHLRDGLVHERLPHEHAKPRTRGGCKGAVSRLGKGRSEDDRCGRTAGKHTAEEELRLPFGKACIGVALLQWQNELLQPLQELPPL
jgi:hypothetical protein